MKTYGYARVSTKEQNVNRQLDALMAFPLEQSDIYVDHCTGATFERDQYRALMRRLRPGDVMVVKSIDRLGRNYTEFLNEWRHITNELGSEIVVLDMPLLDTRSTGCDLTGKFLSDVVLQLLSYVAEVERENIRARQAEGIASALARGTKFGRPRKEKPADWEAVLQQIQSGELSRSNAALQLGVSRNTLLKWLREEEALEARGLPGANGSPHSVSRPSGMRAVVQTACKVSSKK